jgi:hypothetical protein
MDSDNAYEMTPPAVKLLNRCRGLAVMTDEQFMLLYFDHSKKQLLTILAINNHQETCTFPWSGFKISSLQERSPPITQAVPSSSGLVLPDLPPPDTNDLDTIIPIENNQQEGDEQQAEFVPNRRRRMDSTDSDNSYQAPRTTIRRRQSTETRVNEFEDVQRLLRTFAEERKYQRYGDNRPVP